MNEIVEISGVSKHYGAVTAVRDVSLRLSPGEAVALVGHNGAGKTTLIKLILGLVEPSSGSVRVLGEDPKASGGATARRSLGYLPENVAFHGAMTGRELLSFYARLKGKRPAQALELLHRVGLAEEAERRRVATYSKGMRQRLGLAQALIGDPQLLLLDEPTSGLDPVSRQEFYETIDTLRGNGATILISTHALAEVEGRVDKVAVMHRGRLAASGSLFDLRRSAALPLKVRLRVQACSTGKVLARVGDYATCDARDVTALTLSIPPSAKMTLLHDLDQLRDWIEDVEIETPGLDQLYRHLVSKEEDNR